MTASREPHRLTNTSIAKLVADPNAEYQVRDTAVSGLMVRVRKSGAKVYAVVYGRGKLETLGRVEIVSLDEARQRAREILQQAARGEDVKTSRQKQEAESLTYREFLDQKYLPWLKANLRHGEYAYSTLVKSFPELHRLKLVEITPAVVEDWRTSKLQEVNKRIKRKITSNTINRQLSDLKACLHRARDIWDIPISNKLDRVKPCKVDKAPKIRFLTRDEEDRLRTALDRRESDLRSGKIVYALRKGAHEVYIDPKQRKGLVFADHLKPAVLISLNTGLRRGELLHLRWEDVHLDRAQITVLGTTTKTNKTRHVDLNDEALSIFRDWKAQSGKHSRYVFAGPDSEPFGDMDTSWATVLKAAKITRFRWHDLRHSFASKLVQRGVPLNVVRDLLGHQSYSQTLKYSHLAPHNTRDAVAKLND